MDRMCQESRVDEYAYLTERGEIAAMIKETLLRPLLRALALRSASISLRRLIRPSRSDCEGYFNPWYFAHSELQLWCEQSRKVCFFKSRSFPEF